MKTILYHLLTNLFFLITVSCNGSQNVVLRCHKKHTLLMLVNKRLEIAPLVAKSKWKTNIPIDDPSREKIILDDIDQQAKKLGLDQKFVKNFFRAQFEAGKIVQKQLHRRWEIQNQPPFTPRPNLQADIRPMLDILTPQLLIELGQVKQKLCLKPLNLQSEARIIINPRFNDSIVQIAIKPLEEYCESIR